MARAEITDNTKKKAGSPAKITFKCQGCGKERNLEDMRVIKRFFPMMVVCRECEKELR
jgi:hypothetical protein